MYIILSTCGCVFIVKIHPFCINFDCVHVCIHACALLYPHSCVVFGSGMRLIGIARNEYIDIMNKYRSKVQNTCMSTVHHLSAVVQFTCMCETRLKGNLENRIFTSCTVC